MIDEERLSLLPRDPGWSLPPWPPGQAMARIRRAARRQRLLAVCRGAAVAVIAGAVALAAVSHVARVPPARRQARRRSPGRAQYHAQALPQVGSSGFPATVYPAPVAVPVPGRPATLACPAPACSFRSRATEPPPPRSPACAPWAQDSAANCSSRTGRSGRPWRTADGPRRRVPVRAAPSSVRYSGPRRRAGVGELASVRRAVATACGDPVMRATWVIVSGLPGSTITIARRGAAVPQPARSRAAVRHPVIRKATAMHTGTQCP